jgi:hypothetical protein
MCASNFLVEEYHEYRNCLLAIEGLVVIVSVLSPVLPYALKKTQKAYHLAGLIFFALVYGSLFLFYCSDACYQPGQSNGGDQPEQSNEGGDQPEQSNERNLIQDILSANKVLSVVAFLSAIPSAALYEKDKIDFELSLWVS